MLSTRFADLRTILCIGAHPDDIEIGCGGTLLSLIEAIPGLEVHWVVLSDARSRTGEAVRSAAAFLSGVAKQEVVVETFRDSFFPYDGAAIKEFFNQLATGVSPDLIFTHCRDDRHQDHRLVAELTWNTFRDHLILEYEIPKYEGDLGHPNSFMPLSPHICERKVSSILEHFQSQRSKAWFTADTLWAMLRIRGVECAAPEKFAEAFHCRKLTLCAAPVDTPAMPGRRNGSNEAPRGSVPRSSSTVPESSHPVSDGGLPRS